VPLGDEAKLGGDMVDPLAAFRLETPGAFECRSGQSPRLASTLSMLGEPTACGPSGMAGQS